MRHAAEHLVTAGNVWQKAVNMCHAIDYRQNHGRRADGGGELVHRLLERE